MYEIAYVRNGNWQKSYAYVSAASAEGAREALRKSDSGVDEILSTVKVVEGTVVVLHK